MVVFPYILHTHNTYYIYIYIYVTAALQQACFKGFEAGF